MLTYIRGFLSFKKDERAVTAVEYGLIAAFIAAALIAALPTVTKGIGHSFGNIERDVAGSAGVGKNVDTSAADK